MPLFPKLSIPRETQLEFTLSVMLARVGFSLTGSYDHPELKKWLDTSAEIGCDDANRTVTVRTIVEALKINFHSLDKTTLLQRKSLDGTFRNKLINSYILTRCSSRAFGKAFFNSGASKGGRLKSKLRTTLTGLGGSSHRCFTMSYNPQRRTRYEHKKKLKKHPGRGLKLLFHELRYDSKLYEIKLKDCARNWISKFNICKSLKKLRGFGPFLAKNMWQLIQSWSRYPNVLDLEFCESGPGARCGANWMVANPPLLMLNATNDHAAFYYSELISDLRKECLSSILLANPPRGSIQQKCVDLIKTELSTLEGCQFILCEWSKIVCWARTGSVVYTRLYWRNLEDQPLEEWEEHADSDDPSSDSLDDIADSGDDA